MLLGAPVIISLIAGIAIPVIIVGIPIYMGRKVHGRCKKNNISGSKHYLTVASGVMMSVFVSPVIAAVTVGKDSDKQQEHKQQEHKQQEHKQQEHKQKEHKPTRTPLRLVH
ncbi:unnamed protein product [Oncorhynchus mykiss]|uniref:Uncharacterized protein n=1 Tax=Oncorhynchus mykiss TaxID=8022 RepID=A0A060YAD5_ONCMY|nr:unnamed protein product [Oncorhynchus mykiss]